MTRRRALLFAALFVLSLSCSEATAPAHAPVYEWRLVLDTPTDTLSFHWPRDMLPVRIWVEDSLDMPARIQEGIATWRAAYLYGEYDAILVGDSADADVIVRVAEAPLKAAATAGRLATTFPGCGGATDIDTLGTRFRLQLPVRMYIAPKYDPETVDLTECFRVTATHELGHSLGLFRHTSDSVDIMYGQPVAQGLSARDVNTAQYLAHWPANMIPTR